MENSNNVIYDRLYIPAENITDAHSLREALTYRIPAYERIDTYKNYSYVKQYFVAPIGARTKILPFLSNTTFEDKRPDHTVDLGEFKGKLWENQKVVVDEFLTTIPTRSGFLHSRAGSGKTVMACYLLSELSQKFLIIVPTSLLLNQWVERLNTFLPNSEIATLGSGTDNYEGQQGCVALINSLRKSTNIDRFRSTFGTIIVDEAHRLPADTFKDTLNLLSAKYKIGLSANTTRKDKKHVMIQDFLGEHCVTNENPNVFEAEIIIVDSGFPFMFRPGMDNWAKALNRVCLNVEYNQRIAETVTAQAIEGRKIVVLSPRIGQLELLEELIDLPVGIIKGSTKQKDRDQIIEKVNNGELSILLCSKQIFEEGADIQRLDTIHLVAPSNNHEKLEQAIGRVERSHPDKLQPLVYDYWHVAPVKNSFEKQQKDRLKFYQTKEYNIETQRL